jgi:hypothetical protein
LLRRTIRTCLSIWLVASCLAPGATAGDAVPDTGEGVGPTATGVSTTPPPPASDHEFWLDSLRQISKLSIAPSYHQGAAHLTSVQAGGMFGTHSGPGEPGALLAAHREYLLGYQRVELSRLDYALRGAGTAATSAMFMSAMAESAGIWDEDTSWYLIGAASALGALLGGTAGTPDDPGARIEVRLEP